ncbi:hypothetical protein ACFV80_42840 [Streptomyces sp. NPDC059862]|uniref:hypothetical protein n=1 Tax=Streptomyces sp. NPDC059862 TaxID=3346975 RepID=UPI00364C35E8
MAATLIGVLAGSLLTSRADRMHWSRDKQIEACAAIVAESTRIQLALRRAWRHGDAVDWVPWNVALGTIWLVGSPAVVTAAATMDQVFGPGLLGPPRPVHPADRHQRSNLE